VDGVVFVYKGVTTNKAFSVIKKKKKKKRRREGEGGGVLRGVFSVSGRKKKRFL